MNLFFDVKIEEDHEEGAGHNHEDFVQTIGRVPFPAGPFNWDDYATEFAYNSGQTYDSSIEAILKNGLRWTSGHVFKLANRATPGTVLIDETIGGLGKNLKIETLAFQANSTMSSEPRVEMVVSGIPEKYLDEETGREEERPGSFPDGPQNSFSVTITPLPDALLDQYGDIYPYGFSQPLQAGGGKVMLWIAPDATYQKAFLEATPQGELSTRGQIVLTVDDQVHHIDLAEVSAGDTVELTDSAYSLEVKGIWQDVNEGQPGTQGTA